MTNEQKRVLLCHVEGVKTSLEDIEKGLNPSAQSLEDRRVSSGWRLEFLLEEVAIALPKDVRKAVEACIAITERVWSHEYSTTYATTQQKASPECLPASDSL